MCVRVYCGYTYILYIYILTCQETRISDRIEYIYVKKKEELRQEGGEGVPGLRAVFQESYFPLFQIFMSHS